MKIILGFVGQMACGKGTATEYLKQKYGAVSFRFSSILTDILNRLYLPNSRENLQKLSQILRENFSEDILSQTIAQDAQKSENQFIVIDGVRRPGDVEHLKNIPGFYLIHIFADIEKRFDRLKKRGEKSDDFTKTFEQFKAEHQNEAELKIEEIAKTADFEIDNNGSLEELCEQLGNLVLKLNK